MFDSPYEIFAGIIKSIIKVFFYTWWIVLPVVLFLIFKDLWLMYRRSLYVNSRKWKLLEIKIPKEIMKSPKAMEQVFASLFASYSYGPNIYAKYLDGKVEPWFSFEIIGQHGGVYFYIYTQEERENLVKSSIYSQYPDAEITGVEDYTDLLSEILPNEVYDLFGLELILAKENYYPIRTYNYFEDPSKEKRLDPLSAITEAMSNLKEGELIWFQILISPTGKSVGNNWREEGEAKIAEIVGRKKEEKKGAFAGLYWWMKNLFWAPIEQPTWPGEKKPEAPTIKFLSPDEQELVKEIANKISKLGFEAFIRFIYIDRRDSFTAANVAAVNGALHQFNTLHLNAFKLHPKHKTLFDSLLARIFPKYKDFRLLYRKRKIFAYYKQRRFGAYNRTRDEKFPVFNTEELATIYHFPTIMVGAPKVKRIEAKKGGPPAGLPVE